MQGALVALVTPMDKGGAVDYAALEGLIEWHVRAKTAAIVLLGTTGEASAIDTNEQLRMITFAKERLNKRIPLFVGTGSHSTQKTVDWTLKVEGLGVDGFLIVTPYYVKPPQEGLYQHYKSIARQVRTPILLYNAPGRTACDLLPETIARLALLPNIIGVKEASLKLERVKQIRNLCGESFLIYSGDDPIACESMLQGANGIISVTANCAPELMHEMSQLALKGNAAESRMIDAKLQRLHHDIFLMSNPIPIKWVLAQMGKIQSGIRLPLVTLDSCYHARLIEAMKLAGIFA